MGDQPTITTGPTETAGDLAPDGDDLADPSFVISVTTDESHAGDRIDRILVSLLTEAGHQLSRTRIQSLIRDGHVTGPRGTIGDMRLRVKPGEIYELTLPPPEPAAPAPEPIPLSVVYEDGDLIVIDKPAGMVVHPAAGHATGTLVNALLAHCGDSLSGIGGIARPGIVHRLDKETSGLLVVAKTDRAHHSLSKQFAAHGLDGRLQRTYLALVWGEPHHKTGTIDARLGRSTTNRTKIAVVRGESGRHAVTHYARIETFAAENGAPLSSLISVNLETGRTHQIRVHMAHIGHPVMGDFVYGAGFKASARKLSNAAQKELEALGRQALHAAELGFEHPATGETMHFTSPLPADLTNLISHLRA